MFVELGILGIIVTFFWVFQSMLKFIYRFSEKDFGSGSGFKYPKSKKGWIWLHLTNPSENDIAKIRQDFTIPDDTVHKFFKEQKSIRYSFKPLSFGLVDYYVQNGKVETEKILFVIGENYFITITKIPLPHYDEIYKIVLEKAKKIKDVGYLFHEILDYDVEDNFDVLSVTESKIAEMEKDIVFSTELGKISEIITFKRYLTQMWRRFWRSSKIIFSIKKGLTPINVDVNLIRLLDDIHDTYIYQMEMVSIQKEALTDALTIYESVFANKLAKLSNRINISLKRMTVIMFLWTAIATILSIPNTVATIFGIPEWPLSADMWQPIAALLVISAVIPVVWFYLYWKKMKLHLINEEEKMRFKPSKREVL